MDPLTLILAIILGIIGIFALIYWVKKLPKRAKTARVMGLETSKQALGLLLLVWALAAVVGLWQSLNDPDKLSEVLDFVQATTQIGLGGYYAKAGAENWKKFSTTKDKEDENEQ